MNDKEIMPGYYKIAKLLTDEYFGQHFTKKATWLTKPVYEFIYENAKNSKIVLDPFAGNGDLFKQVKICETFEGYDIDEKFGWKYNDSLLKIPVKENTFILTNPPYLSKNSCKRKGFLDTYEKYFRKSFYTDLYLIALEKMIETNMPGVAIVPETFINSKFNKNKINRIVIIEDNPFEDTETPVCVVCFNGKEEETKIYKNNDYVCDLNSSEAQLELNGQTNFLDLKFNNKMGSIAIKCVDTTNENDKIRFMKSEDLNYDLRKIKSTSRAITIVLSNKIEKCYNTQIDDIINEANNILNDYRNKTSDVFLSPFKGNNKEGKRRRRLDFYLARNILEIAYKRVIIGLYKGD